MPTGCYIRLASTVPSPERPMWNFESNRNRLRERMLIAAPEANPHQFVQRVLLARDRSRIGSTAADPLHKPGERPSERRTTKTPILDRPAVPATQS